MEGLWSVLFRTSGHGPVYGVAVFHRDHILGGDQAFYWIGTFNRVGNQVNATINARSHSGQPVGNIFGQATAAYSLQLTALVPPDPPVGAGIKATGPAGFVAELTRRA